MQGKLFQRCTHFLYYSVLSLGGKVNTRRMSQPDMESIFTKIIYEIFWSYETIMWIILVYKFRPERTGFNMYAEYTQQQLTFLAFLPWPSSLNCIKCFGSQTRWDTLDVLNSKDKTLVLARIMQLFNLYGKRNLTGTTV